MKIYYKLLIPLFVGFAFTAKAQMTIERDSLFGNEWIDYAKTYFRIPIAADGVYRLSTASLTAAGVPASVAGSRFQIFLRGREIPIYTSTNAAFGGSDFIEFYARKNRGEMDSLMYAQGEAAMLNPEASVYNDTIHYFLTWNTAGVNKRVVEQPNTLTNLPAAEAQFWHVEKFVGSEQATKPEMGSGVYLPEFTDGEGLGTYYSLNKSISLPVKAKVDGQAAQAKIRWTGRLYSHYTTIKINDVEVARDTAGNFGVRNRTFDIPADRFGATFSISLKGEASTTDDNSVGVVSLRYARKFDFDNKNSFEFSIAASDATKYLEISNFNAGGVAPILYDLTNNWRMTTTLESGKVRVALPPSVSERNFILIATNNVTINATLKTQPFTDLRTDGGDYILISSSRHISDASNNIKQYADYRKTVAGGSFKPTIVDVEQLYYQFGYGIARHPMSIRNFTQFIKQKWANPRYIVLVGKAREYRTSGEKTDMRKAENQTFDVPTWGYPGSDVLLASTRKNDEPLISIGRIAITNTSELKIYLDKVKEYESVEQTAPQTLDKREWFKNIMHLSGGGSNEIASIAANMNAFKNIIENNKFGGYVTTFGKSNLDPVQTAQNDQIFDRINKGVSIVSFYGHSSVSILDFDINVPSAMKNKGKYPLFMALGCSAANIHQNFAGVSENFVFYQDKGMSAFIGTTGSSFLHTLNIFATELYNNLGETLYGETIGNIVKKTIGTYSSSNIDQSLRSVIQEFTINGDPALHYNVGPGSDYLVDEKTVQFDPNVLNAQLDSFNVTVVIANIGTARSDSMNVLFRQQLPNGLIYDLKQIRMKSPQYRTTLKIRLPMPKKVVTAGLNRLHIRVDADNEIAELPSAGAESNNEARLSTGELGIPFYILDNNAKPVYPAEFAIVGKTPVVLKASTSDALAKSQNYIMEIDTTERFNSPMKQSIVVAQKGGVLKWTPTVSWRDSGVYYWRISVDSTSPLTGFAWEARSFTYIKDREGWGQSHYFQFAKNDYTTLQLNSDDRKFTFSTDVKTVEIRYPYGNVSPTFIPLFLVNNENYTGRNWGYPTAGIYVTVFDEPTGVALKRRLYYGEYGIPHPNGPQWDINSYVFTTDAATAQTGRKGLMDFLNVIPEKSIVQIFTVQQDSTQTYYPERWANDSITLGSNIFKMLEAQGAKRVRELATVGSKPYTFVYQKGVEPIAENRGERFLDGAPLFYSMKNRWFKGEMESRVIGPVAEWKTLEVNYNEDKRAGSTDTLSFDVIGMTAAEKGVETVLMRSVRAANTPLSTINAQQYPFLKLRYNAKDSIQRTSPQLLAWRVLYRGLPDLAVNPNLAYSFSKDSIQQGEKINVNVAVENVSEIDADSVTVQWTMRDQFNNETSTNKKFAPLSKNANFNVPIILDSKAWTGRYNFEFTVNPRNAQPELYLFNNYLQKPFVVTKDKKRPLLDVHIDGLRVVPNGIVSPKPTIEVSLIDDNPYLRLDDTSVLSMTLQYPNGQKKNIAFNDPTQSVKFTPASAANQNKASVEFKPIFTQDGTYQLTVKGKDKSDNAAGDVDYLVNFQVITKSSISNVLNYPNPFSTRTQFVYTLTGEAPPQYFRIQIMTVSGKVVREITQEELGVLKIGTHKTDYAWDGRDEYGNQLANGVYLYRVIAKGKDGKAFEGYEGDMTNDLFKKGIGKLVILR
jgi:hypothetical protein